MICALVSGWYQTNESDAMEVAGRIRSLAQHARLLKRGSQNSRPEHWRIQMLKNLVVIRSTKSLSKSASPASTLASALEDPEIDLPDELRDILVSETPVVASERQACLLVCDVSHSLVKSSQS